MLKIQIMDMLLPWLLKTGGKLLITVLIAVIGYKVIRAIRKGVGRSMEKAGLEVTLRKFLDALLYAVLIGLLVFMVAEELGIKSSSLVTIVVVFVGMLQTSWLLTIIVLTWLTIWRSTRYSARSLLNCDLCIRNRLHTSHYLILAVLGAAFCCCLCSPCCRSTLAAISSTG